MRKPKRRGPGRPKSDNPSNARIDIRITPRELKAWKRAAEKYGEGLSAYIRIAVRSHMISVLKEG